MAAHEDCSDHSSIFAGYVTGAAITIDGGLSLTNWFDAPVLE